MTSENSGAPDKQEVPEGMVQAFSPSGGLDYLVPTTRILIIESREFIHRYNGYKQYNILDQDGRRILFAGENAGIPVKCCCCCTRIDRTHMRNWSIDMYNHQGISVMNGIRTSDHGSLENYGYNCQVSAFGQMIGGISQATDHSCCKRSASTFTIVDGTGAVVLIIPNGTINSGGCCGRSSWNFPLMTPNGDMIGVITTFDTSAVDFANTKFGAEFPADLDVKIKALLIYATIMIDFYYFDIPPPRRDQNKRH